MVSKLILFLFATLTLNAQIDTAGICNFSGGFGIFHDLSDHYLWANFIVIDSNVTVHNCDLFATRYFIGEATVTDTRFNIIDCAAQAATCVDELIPGIAVLKDSCIRDDEWNNDGYAEILIDSASFFTLDAFMLYQLFGVQASDDCGIDSFYVKSLLITPPNGVARPPNGTKRFDVTFRAVDFAGRSTEQLMTWVRNDDPNCLLD